MRTSTSHNDMGLQSLLQRDNFSFGLQNLKLLLNYEVIWKEESPQNETEAAEYIPDQ
jgi:hypothetical protein